MNQKNQHDPLKRNRTFLDGNFDIVCHSYSRRCPKTDVLGDIERIQSHPATLIYLFQGTAQPMLTDLTHVTSVNDHRDHDSLRNLGSPDYRGFPPAHSQKGHQSYSSSHCDMQRNLIFHAHEREGLVRISLVEKSGLHSES